MVEDLWDSIALGKRYEAYKTGKQNLYDWKSVHKTLKIIKSLSLKK
ncbi:Uncharacterized protein dnm_078620 [Desulfonema magnum]|uniref:Uncharacterized protein n=1 Tax=Desulfonema magnum TaxID=45655 RepID=A0A975BV05_9BACT|nr:Uncharacterized protein dnm_078620 [Desulfonema magnum]